MYPSPLPNPVRIVSDNVIPVPSDGTEPAVITSRDTLEPEVMFEGTVRKSVVGTQAFPPSNDGPLIEKATPGAGVFLPGGLNVYYLDFAPGFTTSMHRTPSLDYLVVLNGTPTYITPEVSFDIVDGDATSHKTKEIVCHEGEIVVQRGQMHAWSNRTDAWVRMVAFVSDAEVQKIEVGANKQTRSLEEMWTKWVPGSTEKADNYR